MSWSRGTSHETSTGSYPNSSFHTPATNSNSSLPISPFAGISLSTPASNDYGTYVDGSTPYFEPYPYQRPQFQDGGRVQTPMGGPPAHTATTASAPPRQLPRRMKAAPTRGSSTRTATGAVAEKARTDGKRLHFEQGMPTEGVASIVLDVDPAKISPTANVGGSVGVMTEGRRPRQTKRTKAGLAKSKPEGKADKREPTKKSLPRSHPSISSGETVTGHSSSNAKPGVSYAKVASSSRPRPGEKRKAPSSATASLNGRQSSGSSAGRPQKKRPRKEDAPAPVPAIPKSPAQVPGPSKATTTLRRQHAFSIHSDNNPKKASAPKASSGRFVTVKGMGRTQAVSPVAPAASGTATAPSHYTSTSNRYASLQGRHN